MRDYGHGSWLGPLVDKDDDDDDELYGNGVGAHTDLYISSCMGSSSFCRIGILIPILSLAWGTSKLRWGSVLAVAFFL